MSYDKLANACKDLGYHGICPEALAEIEGSLADYDRDVRVEFRCFMVAATSFFADPTPEQVAEREERARHQGPVRIIDAGGVYTNALDRAIAEQDRYYGRVR